MEAKNIIITAMSRSGEGRGLRIIGQNKHLSEGHMSKADHNLVVMTDLDRLGHEDWIVITAYYAMYQSALALLAKIGLESKEHTTTVAVLEYLFGGHIGKELIGKFDKLKEKKESLHIVIEEKYVNYFWKIKRERETVQCGISIGYKEKDAVINHAREFVSKIKLVNSELNEKLVEEIIGRISAIKKEAEKLKLKSD